MRHALPARPHLRLPVRLLALVAAGVLALTGCSSTESTGAKGYITGDGTARLIDAPDRGNAIELSGEDLDGEPLSLEQFRGQPVVVNVWWSACPPCRKEQPDLTAAAKDLKGVAHFVGINIRDSGTAQAKGYQRKFDVEYDSFYSPDGKALLPFSGTVPPNAIPSTVILDAEGRVAASIIGSIPSKLTLVGLVEDVADSTDGATTDG